VKSLPGRSLLSRVGSFFSPPPPPPRTQPLFVYGTLKRGFHWHGKYVAGCEFLGEAVSMDRVPLVVGASGVPYCLEGEGNGSEKRIVGEVYLATEEQLGRMDEYEGTAKGHYARNSVLVSVGGRPGVLEAWIYQKRGGGEALRAGARCVEEYTLEMHRRLYRPVRHIAVKQSGYLRGRVSGWGNVRGGGGEDGGVYEVQADELN
jgi:gamma-glutamylaminecyclotransferase